ncbi:Putative peptidoglycan binding domain-containing protein [Orenia metallireducens]|uniref:Putative peptidoglycan binding domain-containing protein n=1 Tax=Orenia metallireducens TaxID=1413210 RepID=A0A285F3T1_9FIRM|nr:peptidoglycan-binding protein [Orenia metallireducens]SNY05925.1 Putative peptidoglycan binding domain-containing protein [Orenia metallireducens]
MNLTKILLLCLLISTLVLPNSSATELKGSCGCHPLRHISLQTPVLKGDDVWELQSQLKELGFYKGNLNSTYDWNTYLAVRNFQYSKGLNETGIVNEQIWLELGDELNKNLPIETTNNKVDLPKGEVSILVNGYKRQMIVYSNGEAFHTFPVAVGKPSTKSPVGEWAVIAKDKDWGGGFGVRWMRLNVPWGIYGIHGTNKPGSIGRSASHGCIRMFNRDVKVLFEWVKVGTRVKIIGPRDEVEMKYNIHPGRVGEDVLILQEKLRKHGFNPGYTDGRFGKDSKQAMKEFKYLYGLKDDLVADKNTFYILNIK